MPSLGQRKRTSGDVDVEIDMVPVMNMFLVLIPFLLMSSSFLHLKGINTSVPVQSTEAAQEQEKPAKSDIKLTVIVALADTKLTLSATSEELTEAQLKVFDKTLAKTDKTTYPLSEFTEALVQIKNQYPKSDTVIIMPKDDVKYNDIIKTMDAARQHQVVSVADNNGEDTGSTKRSAPKINMLFPHVVLSAEAG